MRPAALDLATVAALSGAGLPGTVINPAPGVQLLQEQRDSWLPIDARLLAHFAEAIYHPCVSFPMNKPGNWLQWVQLRDQGIEMLTAERNRLRAMPAQPALIWRVLLGFALTR